MNAWVLYSLITVCVWGFWGLSAKLASRSVSSQNLLLLAFLGNLLVFPLCLAVFGRHLRFIWRQPDYHFAVLAGIIGALGTLFFYLALTRGEASRVVVMTAMYPVITVILAFVFLHEPVTIHKAAGIAFALAALILLS